MANDLTYAARKTTFRTRKRFHNKQYTPKSKDQPLESERTHFDIAFNKSNVAMHRPTIIFLLSHQITTVQQKNNQPEQSITTNNPRNTQSIIRSKQNVTNKHEKPSNQLIVKSITENNRITFATNNYSFYHIKMCCRRKFPRKPANNTHLIKTRHNHTRQPGQQQLVKIQQTQKLLYLDNIKHARKNNKPGLNPKHKERTTISTIMLLSAKNKIITL